MKIGCVILAGGDCFAELAGRPLVSYALGAVKSFFPEITIIVKNERQKAKMENLLNMPRGRIPASAAVGAAVNAAVSVVAESSVASSPIAGIKAGLAHSAATHAFVLSCSMPFIEGAAVFMLLNKARPNVDCVVYKTSDRVKAGDKVKKYETVCAIYSRRLIENTDDAANLQNVIDELDDTKRVVVAAYEKKQFFSIDTMEDLAKAESAMGKR